MKYVYTSIYKALIVILCMVPVSGAFSQPADSERPTGGNWVHSILNDDEYLWIATDAGLFKLSKLTGEKTFFNHTNAELPDDYFISLAKDKENHIWIGSKRSGVYCFDGNEFKVYDTENSGLKSNQHCSAILVDEENNKWIGSLLYLNKWDGDTWQAWTTPGSDILGIWAILSMKFDKEGVLWLGGETSGDWSFAKFTDNSIQVLYNKGCVRGVEIDDAGNKWLATDHGLIKYDGKKFLPVEIERLPHSGLMDIKRDQEGNLWMISGKYLIKYDGKNFSIHTIPLTEGNNWLTCMEMDEECIWLGTRQDWLLRFEEGVFSPISLSDISRVSKDRSFGIYPNPAKEEINFSLKEGEKPCKVEIYSVLGEIICSESLSSYSVPLSALNISRKGVYLFKVFVSPEKYYSGKLVVAE